MKTSRLFYIFAIILLPYIYSCSSPEKTKPVEKEIAPPGPTVKIHTVEISQMKFIPEEVTVKKGDKIVFVNHDLVNHDVTEESKAWSSSTLEPEKYWSVTATASQNYYCSLHVVMKGKIKVE